jgi:hypothetical protein
MRAELFVVACVLRCRDYGAKGHQGDIFQRAAIHCL